MATNAGVPAPQRVVTLTEQLYNIDSDLRYMSLNDMISLLNTNGAAYLSGDYAQCAKIVDGFLKTLNDSNGEVQNMTIKCLSPFVLKCDPTILCPLLHKIGTQTIDKAVDASITAMALRTIVVSLPRPISGLARSDAVKNAYSAVSRVLIPRLVGYMPLPLEDSHKRPPVPRGFLQDDLERGTDSNAIEILTEIAKCYGPMLHPKEVQALEKMSLDLLEAEKSGSIMKKKAVAAISALSQYFSDSLLSSVISRIIEKLRSPHLVSAHRKLYFNLFAAMAKSIPSKFGPHLKQLVPFVTTALSKQEMDDQKADENQEQEHNAQADEVRESAIIALDAFYAYCTSEMYRFNKETLEAILRFLKYDPNTAEDFEDDMDDADGADDDFEADEDFEEDEVVDDEDDVSWKVRRTAARALQTIITVRGKDFLDNGEAYERIARALVDRFKEREETVRVEVVQTTSTLVRQSKHQDPDEEELQHALNGDISSQRQMTSRKRRRADSGKSMSDPLKYRRLTGSVSPGGQSPVPSGAPSNLARVCTDVVRGALKMALGSPAATKLVSVTLLKDLVAARRGGVNDFLKELFGLINANVGSPAGAALQLNTASSGSLHIESLQLLSEVAKTTSSQALQPYIANTIPTLGKLAEGKSPQLAVEALKSAEQLVKALTPPRTGHAMKKSSVALTEILNLLVRIISSRISDLLTRQQAILVMGTLLGRTLSREGSKLLSQQQRESSLKLLLDTCQNETTRYVAIKAVESMAAQGPENVSYPQDWFTALCTELGNQLRKLDRALRGASLQTLRTLIVDRKGSKNITDPKPIIEQLISMLSSGDLHLVGPAIQTLGAFTRDSNANVITKELVDALCELLKSPLSASVVDQLSFFMECAGKSKDAKSLMHALLQQVGVGGTAAVVGKVVGDLLVSAGANAGVDVNAFLQELQSTNDDRRRCLALSVLGEYGLRSGSTSTVKPDLFLKYFEAKDAGSEVPMAAAMALGRTAAGSGNIKTCVPVILSRATNKAGGQNVALHSIKEVLQHSEDVQDLAPFIADMWKASIATADDDKSRTVGAECMSKIAEMDPAQYLQALQALLDDQKEQARLLSIIALRDIFTYTDHSYNKYLRPIFVASLNASMHDSSPENRRNALNTFSAAIRGKPELTLPNLSQLLPLVLDLTHEDPALVREVSIGPFKQKVDDGLEARKAAYEVLYGLLEQSSTAMSPMVASLFPRIVGGLEDDPAIRALCIHMLVRLAGSEPTETSRWLDDIATPFEKILAYKPKETAVRTEVEKSEEIKRSVVKTSLQLTRKTAASSSADTTSGVQVGQGGVGAKWQSFMEEVRKEWSQLVKDEEKEMRERGL